MAHQYADDDSGTHGLSCNHCGMPQGHRFHKVLDAAQSTVPMQTAPVTALHGQSTSHAAAAAAAPRYGTFRATVLALIDARPMGVGATDDELEDLTGRTHQSVSACRNSLMKDGLIEPQPDLSGDPVRRITRSGNPAMAWRTTLSGADAVARNGPAVRHRDAG